MSETPTTQDALQQFAGLPPVEAVIRAWLNPGPHPDWHRKMQNEVRRSMPLLARALDRLAAEDRS